jgi:hypothetical protein
MVKRKEGRKGGREKRRREGRKSLKQPPRACGVKYPVTFLASSLNS